MSNGSIGYLANIEVSDTQNGTYTALVTEPTLITIPHFEVTKVKATHLQSPNKRNEYIPGMFDQSAESYEANYIKADYIALKAIEGLVKWFKISSSDPDGAGAATPMVTKFPGYVHKVTTDFKAEDLSVMKWEIQPTNDIITT